MKYHKNCVYKFINNENQVIYIGKALNLENRINNNGHIKKHLPNECYDEISIIEYVDFKTKNDMDFAERYYIQKYNPKYNCVNSDKPITIEVVELDKKNWSIYSIHEEEILRQLEDFKSRNMIKDIGYPKIEIKIDFKLLEYIKFFSLKEHIELKRYKIYKEFQKKGKIHELKKYLRLQTLEEEVKSYKNTDMLDELIKIDKDLRDKIKYELHKISSNYKLLTYGFSYPVQEFGDNYYSNNYKVMTIIEFNQHISLRNNCFGVTFVIRFIKSCCKNTCERCNDENRCEGKKYRNEYLLKVECN